VRLWILSILVLALVSAAPAWAQTDDDPPIFTVTGTARTYTASTSEFEHWVRVASTDAGGDREGSRRVAFQLLLRYAWIAAEADLRGVIVSDEEAEAELWSEVDQTFPSRRAFRRWLRRSGMTEADIRMRVRMDMVSARITEPVLEQAEASVTDEAVDQYLAKRGGRYRLPESRVVRIIHTKRRAAAVAAKRELLAGVSWRTVGQRYSRSYLDGTPVRSTRRGLDAALARRVFRARPRRIVGPVRTQSGYYVFRVTRVHPERELSLARSRRIARLLLVMRAQEAAINRYTDEFVERWQARTVCAPRYATYEGCGSPSGSSKSAALMSSSHSAGLPSPLMRSISSSSRSERHATASSSRDADIISAWWSRTSRSRVP
jgi:PPIC-type PPIASE domain